MLETWEDKTKQVFRCLRNDTAVLDALIQEGTIIRHYYTNDLNFSLFTYVNPVWRIQITEQVDYPVLSPAVTFSHVDEDGQTTDYPLEYFTGIDFSEEILAVLEELEALILKTKINIANKQQQVEQKRAALGKKIKANFTRNPATQVKSRR